jgi:opacity protein-like surface antigen
MRSVLITAFALVLALAPARAAQAQESGPRVSGFFSASVGDGEHTFATGGAVGYRFSPHFGFDLEIATLPDLDLTENNGAVAFLSSISRLGGLTIPGVLVPPGIDFDVSGRAVAFLANFVTELPVLDGRVVPFISGGGGIANVKQDVIITPVLATQPGGPRVPDVRVPDPIRASHAENDLALTIGGGVDFRLWRGMAVGADLKYLRLFGTAQDLHFTRIGSRIAYRF